ncbi:protein of unknown function [Streptomyces murinus]
MVTAGAARRQSGQPWANPEIGPEGGRGKRSSCAERPEPVRERGPRPGPGEDQGRLGDRP